MNQASDLTAMRPTAPLLAPRLVIPETMVALVEANMSIAVRSGLAQSDLVRSVEAAVAAADANTPVYDVKTMDAMVADSGSLRNFDFTLTIWCTVTVIWEVQKAAYSVCFALAQSRCNGSARA